MKYRLYPYFPRTNVPVFDPSPKLLHSHTPTKAATSLLTSCNNLLQSNIRMRSHGLRQLVEDKSVASCQQTCRKLIVQTCYQQAFCKLFQQVVTSLQMTNCNKPDFNRLVAT